MAFDLAWLHETADIIAVVNNKGGVGKTTISTNSAGLLALSGWRVLLVDLDHQGNAGLDLGYQYTDVDDDGEALTKAISYGDAIEPVNVRPNLDVLIGGGALEDVTRTLVKSSRRPEPRTAVAEMLERILRDHEYDIVIIDCPPSNDTLQTAAVVAANYVLIPVRTEMASLRGLALTATRLRNAYDINKNVDLLGIIVFDTSKGAKRVQEKNLNKIVDALTENSTDEGLRREAAEAVFTASVRHAEATAQSLRDEGLLAHELDVKAKKGPTRFELLKQGLGARALPESAGGVADDLQAVTKELVARLEARREARVG
jgi:cellulose biosynthesis protein BcsQ